MILRTMRDRFIKCTLGRFKIGKKHLKSCIAVTKVKKRT